MAGWGGAVSGLIGGIGSFISSGTSAAGAEDLAHGDFAAATSYANAEAIAKQNEKITEESTKLQEYAVARKTALGIGRQTAEVGTANVEGGNAGDLLRMSMQQGGLAKAVVGQQGAINKNAFASEAEALAAQEASAIGAGNAALKSAEAQRQAGFMNLIGGAVGMLGLFF